MAGKHLFDEDQEFNDRLFLAERNLMNIGVINLVAVETKGQEPHVRLDYFVRWALRVGWNLPAELSENRAPQAPEFPPAPPERIKSDAPTELAKKPQRVAIPGKRDAVKSFVAELYPGDIPRGTTAKHIARQFTAETKVPVDVRTVRRALGRR